MQSLNDVFLSLNVNFRGSFTFVIFLNISAFTPFKFFSKKLDLGIVSRVYVNKSYLKQCIFHRSIPAAL